MVAGALLGLFAGGHVQPYWERTACVYLAQVNTKSLTNASLKSSRDSK